MSLYKTASQKTVMSLLFYNLLIGFGAGLVLPYVNVFISRKLGVDTAVVGVIQSFSQGATALAALLSPVLADRFGRVATCRTLIGPSFLLLIALPPNFYLYTSLYSCVGAQERVQHGGLDLLDGDRRTREQGRSHLSRIAQPTAYERGRSPATHGQLEYGSPTFSSP